jgi:hypothetical protein
MQTKKKGFDDCLCFESHCNNRVGTSENRTEHNPKVLMNDMALQVKAALTPIHAPCESNRRDKWSLFGHYKHAQTSWREAPCPNKYARHCKAI